MKSKSIKQDEMPYGVDFIHFIYRMFGIIGAAFLVMFLFRIDLIGWNRWIFFLISMICIWTINYGISNRKSWLVTLLLIVAALSLIKSFFWVVSEQPTTGYDLALKCIHLLLAIFYGFQIFIFSRKRTREYFKHKGKILFT